jgi:CubicO group peptidase (beta-lactamase class C family)
VGAIEAVAWRRNERRILSRGRGVVMTASVTEPGSAIAAGGAPGHEALIAGLARFVPEVMADHATPGLTLAIAQRGQTIWRAGFGFSNLARREPMTPQTLIRAGSMSKLYTGVAVLQLVEQGRLGIFDDIGEHLSLPLSNPYGPRPVTIYDLLTFQSGLERDTTDCSFTPSPSLEHFVSNALCTRALKEYDGTVARWAGRVGEEYRYSNLGVSVLGRLVEVANPAGHSFERYVHEHIVAPLGMEGTVLASAETMAALPEHLAARLSTGYAIFGDVRVPSPNIHAAAAPAANLLTTPGDHIQLLIALLQGGRHRRGAILSPESVRLMTTPQVPITLPEFTAPGADWWSGLAVRLNALNRPDYNFGHGGAYVWGWWSDARAYPARDLAVVIAANGWNMVQWHVPGCVTPHELIFRYILQSLPEPRRGRSVPPDRSLGWRLSYLVGLIMVERCRGLLGVEDPMTTEMIEAMGKCADVCDGADDKWDRDGFVAGAQAMLAIDMTPDAIRAFLHSKTLAVPEQELHALFLRLRGLGELPVPVQFWDHTLPGRHAEPT